MNNRVGFSKLLDDGSFVYMVENQYRPLLAHHWIPNKVFEFWGKPNIGNTIEYGRVDKKKIDMVILAILKKIYAIKKLESKSEVLRTIQDIEFRLRDRHKPYMDAGRVEYNHHRVAELQNFATTSEEANLIYALKVVYQEFDYECIFYDFYRQISTFLNYIQRLDIIDNNIDIHFVDIINNRLMMPEG